MDGLRVPILRAKLAVPSPWLVYCVANKQITDCILRLGEEKLYSAFDISTTHC
jgi:hypothetical protein